MIYSRDRLFRGSRLSPLQQRVLQRDLCGCGSDDAYSDSATLLVWVAHLLHAQEFLDDAQWRLSLERCRDYLANVAPSIMAHIRDGAPYPPDWRWPLLAFSDGRYLTWPADPPRYIDLHTGDTVDATPPPIITVAYHLDAIASQMHARYIGAGRERSAK